jgi:hypothetical protein
MGQLRHELRTTWWEELKKNHSSFTDNRNERTETSQRKRDLAKTFENSLTFEFKALRNGISPSNVVTLRDTPQLYWRRHSAETARAP